MKLTQEQYDKAYRWAKNIEQFGSQVDDVATAVMGVIEAVADKVEEFTEAWAANIRDGADQAYVKPEQASPWASFTDNLKSGGSLTDEERKRLEDAARRITDEFRKRYGNPPTE